MTDREPLSYRSGFVARPEMKQTPNGQVFTFGLGMPHNYDNGSDITFLTVEVWNEDLIPVAQRSLTKGARVAVEGYMKTREHNDRVYTSLRATRIGMVDYLRKDASAAGAAYSDEDFPF